MLTLKLFNAVLKTDNFDYASTDPFIISDNGFIIAPAAMYAEKEILAYYENERLNGNELNKTFHKSWSVIRDSSREGLLVHQIRHYISTYGSDFKDEIYIPDEVLDVPDLKLKFKVIRALTKEELTEKCLDLLRSGIALKEETIRDILSLLHDQLDYVFTGNEGIRNKEANVILADLYNVYPNDPTEFLRYILFKTTGSSLLIKNKKTIEEIKASTFDPTVMFKRYGLERLATIFNRFKPLFLAYKNRSGKTVNRIAKLSKKLHKPMISNPLNLVTVRKLQGPRDLAKATTFALFKALSVCHNRMQRPEAFVYRIRNGKSWVTTNENVDHRKVYEICKHNYSEIINYLKQVRLLRLNGKTMYIPEDVEYALPTSEKMFIGNIPTGTKFYADKLAAGIYWRDDWGARDLDLSGITAGGKVGWNSSYNDRNKLYYSGDMTSAPNGACEYLYATKDLDNPVLVMNNVYSGQSDCDYKIIVGKGDNVDYNYMLNPNNLFAEVKCQSVEKQTILGLLLPEGSRKSFVLLNFGAGSCHVSGYNPHTETAKTALVQQWSNPIYLSNLATELGIVLVDDKEQAEIDLSMDNLEKDTFTRLFS